MTILVIILNVNFKCSPWFLYTAQEILEINRILHIIENKKEKCVQYT